jgi:hypothetical protein
MLPNLFLRHSMSVYPYINSNIHVFPFPKHELNTEVKILANQHYTG